MLGFLPPSWALRVGMGGSFQKTESKQDGPSALGRAQGSLKSAAMLGSGSTLGPEGSRPRQANPLSCFLLLVPLSLFYSPTISFFVTKMGTYPAGRSQARAGLGCCQSFSRIATQHPEWFTPLGDQALGPHPAPTPAAARGCFKHPWGAALARNSEPGVPRAQAGFQASQHPLEPPFPVREVSVLNQMLPEIPDLEFQSRAARQANLRKILCQL